MPRGIPRNIPTVLGTLNVGGQGTALVMQETCPALCRAIVHRAIASTSGNDRLICLLIDFRRYVSNCEQRLLLLIVPGGV